MPPFECGETLHDTPVVFEKHRRPGTGTAREGVQDRLPPGHVLGYLTYRLPLPPLGLDRLSQWYYLSTRGPGPPTSSFPVI